jgi:hypothetical protein
VQSNEVSSGIGKHVSFSTVPAGKPASIDPLQSQPGLSPTGQLRGQIGAEFFGQIVQSKSAAYSESGSRSPRLSLGPRPDTGSRQYAGGW